MLTKTTNTLSLKNTANWIGKLGQRKFVQLLFKFLLSITLAVVLYYQLFARKDLTLESLAQEFVTNLSWEKAPYVVAVLLLMPLNWFFETKKWLALMQKIEPIAMTKALRAVLVGVTCSLFTPNRVGEYGGRVMMVSKGKRFMSVFATMVGISSQWIVLVIGGWWGLMGAFYAGLMPINGRLFLGLVWLGIIASSCLVLIYFNLPVVVQSCLNFKWTKKWAEKIQASVFEYYNNQELLKALAYSSIRYLIYSFQYLLLLCFFGFQASTIAIFLGILIVYLLQTGIPLPPSTGLLARGNIALLIFGFLNAAPVAATAVLASTFSLWLINVLFPAIIGALCIVQLNWQKQR